MTICICCWHRPAVGEPVALACDECRALGAAPTMPPAGADLSALWAQVDAAVRPPTTLTCFSCGAPSRPLFCPACQDYGELLMEQAHATAERRIDLRQQMHILHLAFETAELDDGERRRLRATAHRLVDLHFPEPAPAAVAEPALAEEEYVVCCPCCGARHPWPSCPERGKKSI